MTAFPYIDHPVVQAEARRRTEAYLRIFALILAAAPVSPSSRRGTSPAEVTSEEVCATLIRCHAERLCDLSSEEARDWWVRTMIRLEWGEGVSSPGGETIHRAIEARWHELRDRPASLARAMPLILRRFQAPPWQIVEDRKKGHAARRTVLQNGWTVETWFHRPMRLFYTRVRDRDDAVVPAFPMDPEVSGAERARAQHDTLLADVQKALGAPDPQ